MHIFECSGSPSLVLILLGVPLDFVLSLSLPPRTRPREWSERDPELQIRVLEQPVEPHKPSSRTTRVCRSERRRTNLFRFLVVHVHLGHELCPIILSPSPLCCYRFPVHGIRYHLLRCRPRVRSVHPLRFLGSSSPRRISLFFFFNHSSNLLLLCAIISSLVLSSLSIGRNNRH